MSTPSKARAKRREWMQKQVEKQSKELDYVRASHKESLRREVDRLTRMIPRDRDDDTLYPSGKIDRPILRVALRRDPWDSPGIFDPSSAGFRHYMLGSSAEIVDLRAVQEALVLPDGTKVVWWSWELSR